MKTILILGGNGFIGSHLVDFFTKNSTNIVYATVHEKDNFVKNSLAKYIRCDLRDKIEVQCLFLATAPDIVINAAAVTTGSKDVIERPYLHVTDNIIINSLVFEACHEFNVKHCIFLSCTVMYQSKDNPQKESDWNISDEIPKMYFGVANMKIFSERLCEFYSRLGRTKFTAIRHSNVFGPRDKFDLDKCHVLPAMIRKVWDAKDSLEIWGDGTAKRDLIYIDDLIAFVNACIQFQTSPYELINCGQGKALSIKKIIEVIQKISGKTSLSLSYNASKANIPTTLVLDCSKAKTLFGWEPKVSFEEGIIKTLEYYKHL